MSSQEELVVVDPVVDDLGQRLGDVDGPATVVSTAADIDAPRRAVPDTSRWRAGIRALQRVRLGAVVALVLLALLPTVATTFTVSTATQVLAFAILALSLHLLMGWTGIMSLGQAGYFGVGAYAAGLLAVHHSSYGPSQLVVGGLAGAVAAAGTGWLLVRSRGGYLLMITIAIGELLAHLAVSWHTLTGGDNGLAAIPFTTLGDTVLLDPVHVYRYALAVFAVCFVVVDLIGRSPFGRTLRGTRDNEPRMRSLGYATYVYKWVAFTIAGALAGVGGAVWVTHTQFVSPHDLNLHQSSMVLVAVAVGGSARLWGPLLGAALIIFSQNMLPSFLEGKGPLVLGIILIAVVYVLPGGISALPERLGRLWRHAR